MPVLLFTRANAASWNIAEHLISRHRFEETEKGTWMKNGVRLVDTNAPGVLEIPTDFDTDVLLVLSSHKSREARPSLTVHIPGNWNSADMGGKPRTLNTAHGTLMKLLLREMEGSRMRRNLNSLLSLETDHHGPTCSVPILFVEIGSTEGQWKDDIAGCVVAEAVDSALMHYARMKRNGKTGNAEHKTENARAETGSCKPETVFGVGGGHYAREFTKSALETGLVIGHICPKYAIDSLAEDTFRQAIERNVEKCSGVLLVKDGANAVQKERIRKLAAEFGVGYSEI